MRYYDQPCNVCGSKITHTSRRGRPRVRCVTCPPPKFKRIVSPNYNAPCERCGTEIPRTGHKGRPPKFCLDCASIFLKNQDEVPF